ncbi:electron transporter RnfB, partial [bacterium]|nr:electron transporter RnfB [bacterium]
MAVIILMALLGLVFGLVIAFFSKKFAVHVDHRIEKVLEMLPGANCGACGKAGCAGFAEAVVNG